MSGAPWRAIALTLLTLIAVLCVVIALLLWGLRLPAPPMPAGLEAIC